MTPLAFLGLMALVASGCILLGWVLKASTPFPRVGIMLPPPPPVPLESLFPRDTLNDYQERAMYFHKPGPERLASYSLGLCGESGEVAEMIKKHIGHGKDVDVEKLKLELGDVLWYIAGLATLYNLTLDEIAEGNLQKLSKRYPAGWVKGGGIRGE